jgi:hypothetical protein
MQRLYRIVAGVALIPTLLSCGGGTTEPVPILTTLTLSFPTGTIQVGQSAATSVSAADQFGAAIAPGSVSWSTGSSAIATVNVNGVVTGVAVGQTQVIASAGGKQAQASVTVVPIPVQLVSVTPPAATLDIGASQQLTATPLDIGGNVLSGRVVTWATSDQAKATVSSTGLVTALAAGAATITATSEGKSGGSQITVTAQQSACNSITSLQLAVGAMRTLTGAEKAELCLGGGASPSEYVLIPFNTTNVAASTIQFRISATNTTAIQPGSLASLQPSRTISGLRKLAPTKSFEWEFRERERRDVGAAVAARPPRRTATTKEGLAPRYLTNIPADPTLGYVFQLNVNLSGNTCQSAKVLHDVVVVATLPHTMVIYDTLSPAGGYTNAEMIAFAQAFDTLGYALDTLNFGAESDFDHNGRVAILFTPSVNAIPAPPGATVGGLFAARDLADAQTCTGSNEGEMFYMPVPDPNKTINDKYAVKANVARGNLGTLVHEFQHLINAGRRLTKGALFEEVWLNEGLSHIAEEMLYYRISANTPRSNIGVSVLQSSQAQLDAANNYLLGNMGRLSTYMLAPETNSPFSSTDGLEMRGAIWQLLRYGSDRKGGNERDTWSTLVNAMSTGQANFNTVFGNITTLARDWSVAQFTDDAGLSFAGPYVHPSWNFRSVLPPINGGAFPLLTRSLLSTPLDITLNGGAAAYVRFAVAASAPATIGATSSGQAVPPAVDFILIRTQ